MFDHGQLVTFVENYASIRLHENHLNRNKDRGMTKHVRIFLKRYFNRRPFFYEISEKSRKSKLLQVAKDISISSNYRRISTLKITISKPITFL